MRVSGLLPGTEYEYTTGIPCNNATWSPTNTFTTRAPTDASATVVFFGDSGNNERWWTNGTVPAVAARLGDRARPRVDAVIHTGDMAYAWKDSNGEVGDQHQRELSAATLGGGVPLAAEPSAALSASSASIALAVAGAAVVALIPHVPRRYTVLLRVHRSNSGHFRFYLRSNALRDTSACTMRAPRD